jgi:hypothetical protein
MDNCKNCEAVGAAQAKTGKLREALSRPAGYNATMSAMASKTRSAHKGSGKHNRWEGVGENSGNDNLHGYGR